MEIKLSDFKPIDKDEKDSREKKFKKWLCECKPYWVREEKDWIVYVQHLILRLSQANKKASTAENILQQVLDLQKIDENQKFNIMERQLASEQYQHECAYEKWYNEYNENIQAMDKIRKQDEELDRIEKMQSCTVTEPKPFPYHELEIKIPD